MENTKVKISYTVDLENVPEEAGKLIDRAFDRLLSVSEKMKEIESLKENSVHKTIKSIDELRVKIYEVDLLLADSANMYMGYLNAISNPQEQPHPESLSEENA